MSSRDIQNQIDGLYAQIRTYESNINEIKMMKSDIISNSNSIDHDIKEWNDMYDISSDNKWKGKLHEEAIDYQYSISNSLSKYLDDIDNALSDLNAVIYRLEEKINSCKSSISSLEIELANALAYERELQNK
ncbi:MAG: DUF5082 family protein [Pseudobutyrivibrio sp.]|uniref:YwqH-like family protein n=1 Tax=Pseudobutyrivibrio sp. TaxID=2014367 RepID=UPI0025F18913|nr:DUF5082 family protein [Pseudobutyrivibrio sp.]MBQ8488244.1 DUF5082 family protein [Pseudobutyrivibrio sp.]